MQNLNGRKVRVLRIHSSTMLNGYGNLESVVDISKTKNAVAAEMTVVEEGVLFKTAKGELLIYSGNIVSAELVPQTKEQSQAV